MDVRVVFDRDFDSGAWPCPLSGRDAVTGEVWVGPKGFLDLLETRLGLTGNYEVDAVRAAALIPTIRETEGFWSESAGRDPFGTAGTLLRWRDELWMQGWRGEGDAGRLPHLHAVTQHTLPGIPDRLIKVAEALQRRTAVIEAVELLEPVTGLPKLWRQAIEGLEAQQTRIVTRPLERVAAEGDLGMVTRGERFGPKGDGSLQLLRASGPLVAAEHVAAWLASLPDLKGTVIIGSDSLLDAALGRFGLPATGAAGEAYLSNSLLQILPLVLAMGWSPQDPYRALELLSLPASPVPTGIAHRLLRALQKWPGIGSYRWNQELDEGLAELKTEDSDRHERVSQRLETLFTADASGNRCPVDAINKRISLVRQWLHGRKTVEPNDDAGLWEAAITQGAILNRLIKESGLPELTPPHLQRFVQEATAAVPPQPLRAAQAGLAAIGGPGGIAGPVQRVVWWNFTADSATMAARLPLSQAERKALEKLEVLLLDPGDQAVAAANRWRRPLLQVTKSLLMVCPKTREDGEELYPHPLWHEIVARLRQTASITQLVRHEPVFLVQASRSKRPNLSLPKPRNDWRVKPDLLTRREEESYSSLAALLGCPFNWVVTYLGKVQSGTTAKLPEGNELFGNLAHQILCEILLRPQLSPQEAENEAKAAFDREGRLLAASLFMPGQEARNGLLKRIISQAARTLVQSLRDARLTVSGVERHLRVERDDPKNPLGAALTGRLDVVVEPPGLLDMKWSGASYRRDQLRSGASLQLALYAKLLQASNPAITSLPPAAFFILNDRHILTCSGEWLGGERVGDLPLDATWKGCVKTHTIRWSEFQEGKVYAGEYNPEGRRADSKDRLGDDDALILMPPCKFCELSVLCGRIFGGETEQ